MVLDKLHRCHIRDRTMRPLLMLFLPPGLDHGLHLP